MVHLAYRCDALRLCNPAFRGGSGITASGCSASCATTVTVAEVPARPKWSPHQQGLKLRTGTHEMGAFMRAAVCMFAFLFGFASLSMAEEDKSKRSKEKPIQLPTFELNGYSGRLSADQSRIWETPDPTSQFQTGQSASQPYFGLTLSRPLH